MMKVFTVYDSKVEAFANPFFCKTKGEAIRGFADEVANPQSQLNKHPEDFTLFEIGTYDESKGLLTPLDANISLGLAIEFKKVENKLTAV